MTEDKYFSVRNNEFQSNLSYAIKYITENSNFADVTLVCDDEQIEAHKLVLSASSDFFRQILTKNPHPHPLVYLKGVKVEDMKNLLTYMYVGEVDVEKERLNTFLGTAEDLKINGLAQNLLPSDLKFNSLIKKIIDQKAQKEVKMNLEKMESAKRPLIADDDDDPKPIVKKANFGNIVTLDSEAEESFGSNNHETRKQTKFQSSPSIVSLTNLYPNANINASNNTPAVEKSFDTNFSEDIVTIKGDDEGPTETELNDKINEEMDTGELTDEFSNEEKIRKLRDILADFTNTEIRGSHICKICDKVTRNAGHLKEHFEARHIQTRRALFKCEYCGQPLRHSTLLRRHVKTCPSNVF